MTTSSAESGKSHARFWLTGSDSAVTVALFNVAFYYQHHFVANPQAIAIERFAHPLPVRPPVLKLSPCAREKGERRCFPRLLVAGGWT